MVSQNFLDWAKTCLLIKNPQLVSNFYETWWKYSSPECFMLLEYQLDCIKIVDFLLIAKFLASPIFTYSPSTYSYEMKQSYWRWSGWNQCMYFAWSFRFDPVLYVLGYQRTAEKWDFLVWFNFISSKPPGVKSLIQASRVGLHIAYTS